MHTKRLKKGSCVVLPQLCGGACGVFCSESKEEEKKNALIRLRRQAKSAT